LHECRYNSDIKFLALCTKPSDNTLMEYLRLYMPEAICEMVNNYNVPILDKFKEILQSNGSVPLLLDSYTDRSIYKYDRQKMVKVAYTTNNITVLKYLHARFDIYLIMGVHINVIYTWCIEQGYNTIVDWLLHTIDNNSVDTDRYVNLGDVPTDSDQFYDGKCANVIKYGTIKSWQLCPKLQHVYLNMLNLAAWYNNVGLFKHLAALYYRADYFSSEEFEHYIENGFLEICIWIMQNYTYFRNCDGERAECDNYFQCVLNYGNVEEIEYFYKYYKHNVGNVIYYQALSTAMRDPTVVKWVVEHIEKPAGTIAKDIIELFESIDSKRALHNLINFLGAKEYGRLFSLYGDTLIEKADKVAGLEKCNY
jgi:hypothetical protein